MIPTITIKETAVEISIWKKVCNNIFVPINTKRIPNPVFNLQNIFITLLNIKNNERNPKIAKILEKNTYV